MALGATAGALNTMMSSVSDRAVEIATVRALGFSRLSAFIAMWAEAVALAAVGVIFGLVVSWFVFNGWQASTIGANNASISFELTINEGVLLTPGLLGLSVGIVGAALPAFYATRLPLTAALQDDVVWSAALKNNEEFLSQKSLAKVRDLRPTFARARPFR